MRSIILFFLASSTLAAFECPDNQSFDYGVNPPITYPSDCSRFFGYVDYILLKPHQDHLYSGTTYVQGPFSNGSPRVYEVKEKRFSYSFDSGFRVAFGYGLPYDQFGGEVSWTWYQSSASSTDDSPGFFPEGSNEFGNFFEAGLDHTLKIDFLVDPLELHSVSNWKLRYNQIDFTLFREFVIGTSISVKPTLGVQLLFVEERLSCANRLYQGRWKSEYKGAGISLGVDTFYDLGCSLGVYGSGRAALLLSQGDSDHHLTLPHQNLLISDGGYFTGANFETSFGLEWRSLINSKMHFLFIRIGFEQHLLLNQNLFSEVKIDQDQLPLAEYPGGDLSLFGFVARFGIKF